MFFSAALDHKLMTFSCAGAFNRRRVNHDEFVSRVIWINRVFLNCLDYVSSTDGNRNAAFYLCVYNGIFLIGYRLATGAFSISMINTWWSAKRFRHNHLGSIPGVFFAPKADGFSISRRNCSMWIFIRREPVTSIAYESIFPGETRTKLCGKSNRKVARIHAGPKHCTHIFKKKYERAICLSCSVVETNIFPVMMTYLMIYFFIEAKHKFYIDI